MSSHNKVLTFANSILSGGRKSILAFFTLLSTVLTLALASLKLAGVEGRPAYLAVAISLCVASFILFFVLRSLSLSLIAWGLWSEIDWFAIRQPKALIAVGPGGAVIAGLIAKLLNRSRKEEPLVIVANRKSRHDGPAEGREVHCELPEALAKSQDNVIIVTSEVQTGRTLTELRDILLAKYGREFETFSLIVSPQSGYHVSKFIILSYDRGLLPWPDDPSRFSQLRAHMTLKAPPPRRT